MYVYIYICFGVALCYHLAVFDSFTFEILKIQCHSWSAYLKS